MCMSALSLIGSVVQGIGAKREADQQAANYKSQQLAQERQAAIQQTTGAYQAKRKQEEVDRALAAQRAAYSGSGVALSGTTEDVIADSATEGAMDVAAIRWNAGMEADTQRHNAKVSEMNAKNAKKSGTLALLTPIINGVAKFGSSFGQGAMKGAG